MQRSVVLPSDQPLVAEAARRARLDPYHARRRLVDAAEAAASPGGEVVVVGWTYAPDFSQTLLIRHRRLGWLSPGGRLEPGERPADGAAREVVEETGVPPTLLLNDPVAVLGNLDSSERRYGLAYAFVADPAHRIVHEADQPAAWYPLAEVPVPCFDRDLDCLREVAGALAAGRRLERR